MSASGVSINPKDPRYHTDHQKAQEGDYISEDGGTHVSSSVAAANEETIAFPCRGLQRRSSRRSAAQAAHERRGAARPMSALPPKADIGTQSWNVRFVPEADIRGLVQLPRREQNRQADAEN